MTDRELLQQALDALESSRVFVTSKEKINHPEGTEWYDGRIAALRDRLAQPEQKPVAWMYTSQYKGNESYITRYQTDLTTYKAVDVWPLYTIPLQRPWVGLTDEELIELSESGLYLWELWRAIEAKLKEKNT